MTLHGLAFNFICKSVSLVLSCRLPTDMKINFTLNRMTVGYITIA